MVVRIHLHAPNSATSVAVNPAKGAGVLFGVSPRYTFGIHEEIRLKFVMPTILVCKCSWTHVCLSRIKKGIVTPTDRQVDDLDVRLSALANIQSGAKPVFISGLEFWLNSLVSYARLR